MKGQAMIGVLLTLCLWTSFVQGLETSPDKRSSSPTGKSVITAQQVASAFNTLSGRHGVYGVGGASCQAGQEGVGANAPNPVCTSCAPVFELCADVFQTLQSNSTGETTVNTSTQNDLYHVYTYGSFMVVFMMATSLLSLVALPCLRSCKHGEVYKGMRMCVMASGASAIFCYSIFFLMMEVFRLNSSPSEDNPSIIKCVVIIAGMYFFYLLEFTLHVFSGGHDHDAHTQPKEGTGKPPPEEKGKSRRSISVAYTTARSEQMEEETSLSEVSFVPEDQQFKKQSSFVDPVPFPRLRTDPPPPPWHHITPMSWLVGVGDGMRNFVDGLTLGVSLTQNITLGIATAIMLVIYEIPLEFGNFVVLLDNGVRWWVAVIFNIVSSLVFCAGLIVGAILGDQLEQANPWVLAVLFGLFSYIALVNLVPELVSVHEGRLLAFVMTHIGFLFSFGVLYVPAHYRDKIESLFSNSNLTNAFPI